MLDVASALKEKKAGRIFAYATYAIFTNGLEKFDKAYEDGIIDGVFGTNLTYRTPELLSRPWFHEVDVSKYIAYFIEAINHDVSISKIIDPHTKIETLLKKIEDGVEETLTYCDFPSEHWTRIRTNNVIERLNREIRRRTRVVGCFPDGNAALMLVCTRLRHVAGTQWGNKKYMNMKHLEAMDDTAFLVG